MNIRVEVSLLKRLDAHAKRTQTALRGISCTAKYERSDAVRDLLMSALARAEAEAEREPS